MLALRVMIERGTLHDDINSHSNGGFMTTQ